MVEDDVGFEDPFFQHDVTTATAVSVHVSYMLTAAYLERERGGGGERRVDGWLLHTLTAVSV